MNERLPEPLSLKNIEKHRIEAEKVFMYVYGNNDRRDDNLKTKIGLSEKYGIKFT